MNKTTDKKYEKLIDKILKTSKIVDNETGIEFNVISKVMSYNPFHISIEIEPVIRI
jgi:hypothetical protein